MEISEISSIFPTLHGISFLLIARNQTWKFQGSQIFSPHYTGSLFFLLMQTSCIIFLQSSPRHWLKMLSLHLIKLLSLSIFGVVSPRPSIFSSFPKGKDCYQIETENWILVSCPNGKTSLKLKTLKFTIDTPWATGAQYVKVQRCLRFTHKR